MQSAICAVTRPPGTRARIQDEITELRRQISEQQRLIDDPQGAAARPFEWKFTRQDLANLLAKIENIRPQA
jgi:hypothetical protein